MTATSISESFRIFRAYLFIADEGAQKLIRKIIVWGLGGGALLACVSFLGIPALTATLAVILIIGGPARLLWNCKYPVSAAMGATATAIVLPKINEEAWELVKEVAVRAMQALALFGVFALYFSSPLSPIAKLGILERLSTAPILILAFVVAGLCYLVGWRQWSAGILAVTAAFSLLLRVGGAEGFYKKVMELDKAVGVPTLSSAGVASANTAMPATQQDRSLAQVQSVSVPEPPPRGEETLGQGEVKRIAFSKRGQESPWINIQNGGYGYMVNPIGGAVVLHYPNDEKVRLEPHKPASLPLLTSFWIESASDYNVEVEIRSGGPGISLSASAVTRPTLSPPREVLYIHRREAVEVPVPAGNRSKLIILDKDSQATGLTAGAEDIRVCTPENPRGYILKARQSGSMMANSFWFENTESNDTNVTVEER